MKHLNICKYSILFLFISLMSCKSGMDLNDRPNIILIVTDDLGIGSLSCYNAANPKIITPNIDRLANNGWQYNQFYVTSPVCSPSRASILCGKHPRELNLERVLKPLRMEFQTGLSPSDTTFATLLQNNGYQTSLVGKWHLGYSEEESPLNHGFDKFAGFINGHIDYKSHKDPNDQFQLMKDNKVWEASKKLHLAQILTDEAILQLETSNETPMFMMVAYASPHVPILLPNDEPIFPFSRNTDRSSPEKYQQLVNYLDSQVGRLIDAAYKRKKNTLVIFISDQGCPGYLKGNFPYIGGKGTLHEGGVRIPAILYWPDQLASKKINGIHSSLDLYKTILEVSGTKLSASNNISGNSLLNDEIENDETPFVWTFNSQFGIRKKNLKALYAPEEYEEKLKIKYNASFHNMNPTESFIDSTGSKYWVWLYDMNNDSLEQNNVAHRNMDIVKRLWSELNHELKTQNK